jgi:choline dehydrogenase-like flavoprotein
MMDHEADVVVIGAGAVGAAAAWRLASAGLRTICVEQGDWLDMAALDRDGPDWELRRERPLSSNPNIRARADEDPVDDEDSPIKPMIADAVGGTTTHWSAHIPRFRSEDFRVRSLDGVAEDWPISYEELAPFYTLNEARWGLGALPGDPAAPPHGETALPLPTIGPHGRRLASAFDRLGWHWWPVDLVVGRDAADPGTVHCDHIGPSAPACGSSPARRCCISNMTRRRGSRPRYAPRPTVPSGCVPRVSCWRATG